MKMATAPSPHVVYTRLELNDIVDVRPILDGPVHTTTNATQRKRPLGVVAGQLLERRDHAIRIETAIRKVSSFCWFIAR